MRTLENGADVLKWVLGDHLGSTSATVNTDGSLNSVILYTAFGREALPKRSVGREIRITQGVTPTKYRYTGQLAQAESGLYHYFARWLRSGPSNRPLHPGGYHHPRAGEELEF